MRGRREVQYVVLQTIVRLAMERPGIFQPFLKNFFITVRTATPHMVMLTAAPHHCTSCRPACYGAQVGESSYVRRLKLDVLARLVTPENVSAVLSEFQSYVRDSDERFVKAAIQVHTCGAATAAVTAAVTAAHPRVCVRANRV